MALRNGYTHPYNLALSGVDYYHNLLDIPRENAPYTQNCYYRDGIVQRQGMTKLTTYEEIATSKAITGLHRFYYGTNSKQLMASAGTVVKYYNIAAGIWSNVWTGLSDGAQVTYATWGPKDAVYLSNGNNQPVKWNGTTLTTLSVFPSNVRQFLPLLDRLLWIDSTDPSFIRYTQPYDDTVVEAAQNALKVPGPGRIEGMAYYGLKTDTGFATRAIMAKANSLWLLTANDLTPASIDARLDIISDVIGCVAWRTIQYTPIGVIFLGSDRQVYLISNEGQVIPIGHNIKSNRTEVTGIEGIQAASLDKPFAVYHDGFYKLFIPGASTSYNTVQFWLDVERFHQHPRTGISGPWYGPMLGQSISHAVVQNGPGDDGSLIGGEALSTNGGYVYTLNNSNADSGTAITMIYQTNYDDHRRKEYFKTIRQVDAEFQSIDGTLSVNFYDTPGLFSTGQQVSLVSSSVYWDDYYWDEFYWSGANEHIRYQFIPDERIIVRNLSIKLEFSSIAERFKLYSLSAEGQLRSRLAYVGANARE